MAAGKRVGDLLSSAASPTGHTTRQGSQALGHNFSYLLTSRPGAGDAPGVRGPGVARGAGAAAQAGPEAGEEGDCGVSITRGKSQQRVSRKP